jgi:hypothetical protein
MVATCVIAFIRRLASVCFYMYILALDTAVSRLQILFSLSITDPVASILSIIALRVANQTYTVNVGQGSSTWRSQSPGALVAMALERRPTTTVRQHEHQTLSATLQRRLQNPSTYCQDNN